MAQFIKWAYEAEDSTFELNSYLLGQIDKGLYRGFDPDLQAGLNLFLRMDGASSIEKRDIPLVATQYGLWRTIQGDNVLEDATLTLPINAGDVSNPRIDLIVGRHKYVAITGGTAASYEIRQGTPAAIPVEPSLNFPAEQVILGRLFIPAGMTSLTDAGVVYTKAITPDFGGDTTIAHTERDNFFSVIQTFYGTRKNTGTATVTAGDLVLSDNSLDYFDLSISPSPAAGVYTIVSSIITNPPTNPSSNFVRTITVKTAHKLRLTSSIFGRDYYVEAGETFIISRKGTGGSWRLDSGGEAFLAHNNKFQKFQILASNSNTISGRLNAAGEFNSNSSNAQIQVLGNYTSLGLVTLNGISRTSGLNSSSTEGGFLYLVPNKFELDIVPFDFTIGAGFKPIWTPSEATVRLNGSGGILFVEDANYWRLVDCSYGWANATITSLTLNGGGTITPLSTYYRYQIKDNTCRMQFKLTFDLVSGAPTLGIHINTPLSITPKNTAISIGTAHFGATGSNAFLTPCVIKTLSGSQIGIYYPPTTINTPASNAGFPSGLNFELSFTADFEIA